jgi:hypothetical protein
VKSVVESLEQTVLKIHISNGIDSFLEVDASWHLAVSGSPFVLDTFHVPLVYKDHYFLLWALIDLSKEVLVSFVNEDAFELWEKDICVLDEPVYRI